MVLRMELDGTEKLRIEFGTRNEHTIL